MLTSVTADYYEQRACVPGTLIISEATLISQKAAGVKNAPGIWNQAQIDAWKDINTAIHRKECKIFCQLWHQGRAGDTDLLSSLDSGLYSSSAIPKDSNSVPPIAMNEDQIQQVIQDYVIAARNAMAAGFDGVEIHGANGYLPDQFLQDTCNKRTDKWGGNLKNRVRFHLSITEAIVEAIGREKVGIRLSPYSDFLGMLMSKPEPTFEYLLEKLKPMNIAYLHLIEARIRGNDDADCGGQESVRWMIQKWENATPVILNGGFTKKTAVIAADDIYKNFDVIISFGRYFVSNPDLVFRLKTGVPLQKYERKYFYTPGQAKGYVDYPFSDQFVSAKV